MKIGLITGEYPPMQGGVGDYSRELAAALVDLGHEVHVITRAGRRAAAEGQVQSKAEGQVQSKAEDTQDTPGVTGPIVHPRVTHWGWRSWGRILDPTRRLAFDALNIQYQAAAYDLHPAINLFPLLRSLPVWQRGQRAPPIVVTFHDLQVPYLFPKAGRLREWVVTLLARQASAAIVTNRADQLELAARGVGRIERIPIGSNITPGVPDNFDRREWRARLGITPQDFALGFFGFFNARKGIETLVRTLAVLRQREGQVQSKAEGQVQSKAEGQVQSKAEGQVQSKAEGQVQSKAEDTPSEAPSYHLLFIGGTVGSSDATNQAYAEQIKALIAGLSLGDRVHFTGYVPQAEVSAAFAAIDLCVLPYADGISFHHGTLMAALAHKQAIVSTHPLIKTPEVVHGQNVWLVPPEEPEGLASAIAQLAADPERRRRLARGAADLAGEFCWPRIAERTAGLFGELATVSA